MNKLRKILAFIRALLGFLLNFKKKRPDGKEEENEPVPPASGGQEMFPAIVQPALPSGYGDTERDMTGSGNKNSNSPSLPAGDC